MDFLRFFLQVQNYVRIIFLKSDKANMTKWIMRLFCFPVPIEVIFMSTAESLLCSPETITTSIQNKKFKKKELHLLYTIVF